MRVLDDVPTPWWEVHLCWLYICTNSGWQPLLVPTWCTWWPTRGSVIMTHVSLVLEGCICHWKHSQHWGTTIPSVWTPLSRLWGFFKIPRNTKLEQFCEIFALGVKFNFDWFRKGDNVHLRVHVKEENGSHTCGYDWNRETHAKNNNFLFNVRTRVYWQSPATQSRVFAGVHFIHKNKCEHPGRQRRMLAKLICMPVSTPPKQLWAFQKRL